MSNSSFSLLGIDVDTDLACVLEKQLVKERSCVGYFGTTVSPTMHSLDFR